MIDIKETAAVQPLPKESVFQLYERGVAALSESSPPTAGELLDLLVLRERVAEVVAADLPTAIVLDGLVHADRMLLEASAWLASGTGRLLFEDWRKTVQSPQASWWWHLDELDTRATGLSTISVAIAGALLATSLAILTELTVRLLSGGIDGVGITGMLMQGFLTLLAGGALTASGRQWFRRVLHRRRVPRGFHGASIVATSALVLMMAIAGWWSLRYVSRYYNNRGARQLSEGDLSGAMESYTRSLRAHPGSAVVHYNLGAAKEAVHDDEGAAGEYRAAIADDSHMSAAYNNLARLHILAARPSVAIDLLQQGLVRHRPDRGDPYAFHKNLAWAYLESGLLRQGRRELLIAARIRDAAATHCLQAQLIEKESPAVDAGAEWQQCLANADGAAGAPEPAWLALARERVLTGSKP
jgi:hypothetical protein